MLGFYRDLDGRMIFEDEKKNPEELVRNFGTLDKTKHETLLCYSFTTTSFLYKSLNVEDRVILYMTNMKTYLTLSKPTFR